MEKFATMAASAQRPPDLGQMCTVFIADATVQAQNQGYQIDDIFAGFQYSVIHNYMHRVKGQRTFGERIFFQGKPATNESLTWTLASVSGRDVIVPPNPGSMGAWGIGLCTFNALKELDLTKQPNMPLAQILEAKVADRSEFQCQDKQCETLCVIERTKVIVNGTTSDVLSGGACPKYEISSVARNKLPKEAPNSFRERAKAFAEFATQSEPKNESSVVVGVPAFGRMAHLMPWAMTLLNELGVGAKAIESDERSLSRGEELCCCYDMCAPAKIAHAMAETDLSILFMPKILKCRDRDGGAAGTCPMAVGLPEAIAQSLLARGCNTTVLRPEIELAEEWTDKALVRALTDTAVLLGASVSQLKRALKKAQERQKAYEERLTKIGEETMAYGREHGIPTVVVCGSLHIIHDPGINARVPETLRNNGVLCLPMDCFKIPPSVDSIPRIHWGDISRGLRVAIASRERGDVYPLLLTSFGCGPSSFGEQLFESLMEGYPHTTLESDGHGGTAGYVTRLQAFLYTARQHDKTASSPPKRAMTPLVPLPEPLIKEERESVLVFPNLSTHFSRLVGAFYKSFGYNTVACEVNTSSTFAFGRRDCTGKECIPAQITLGAFTKYLAENPPNRRVVRFQIYGEGACRNCMYSVKEQQIIDRLGLNDNVAVRHFGPEKEFGSRFPTKFFASLVAWDIFKQLAAYLRPSAKESRRVDEILSAFCDALVVHTEQPERGSIAHIGWWRELLRLVDRACEAFAREAPISETNDRLRRVLLVGDIYSRYDEFCNDNLIHRLNDRGLRVVLDTFCAVVEYVAAERSHEFLRLPTDFVGNTMAKEMMKLIRTSLYRRAWRRHPWLVMHDIPAVRTEASKLITRFPMGEAPMAVGAVLHNWKKNNCEGAVAVGPWGCAPAQLTESILCHQNDIPILFLYFDGTSLDSRKLDRFAFAINKLPSRSKSPITMHQI
jgi:predicted nucleotide-binding protein (sugar kinase/HSP70/actin superfamily)